VVEERSQDEIMEQILNAGGADNRSLLHLNRNATLKQSIKSSMIKLRPRNNRSSSFGHCLRRFRMAIYTGMLNPCLYNTLVYGISLAIIGLLTACIIVIQSNIDYDEKTTPSAQ
jgi:hypothetical protein